MADGKIPPPPAGFERVDDAPPPPPPGFQLLGQTEPPPPPPGFEMVAPERTAPTGLGSPPQSSGMLGNLVDELFAGGSNVDRQWQQAHPKAAAETRTPGQISQAATLGALGSGLDTARYGSLALAGIPSAVDAVAGTRLADPVFKYVTEPVDTLATKFETAGNAISPTAHGVGKLGGTIGQFVAGEGLTKAPELVSKAGRKLGELFTKDATKKLVSEGVENAARGLPAAAALGGGDISAKHAMEQVQAGVPLDQVMKAYAVNQALGTGEFVAPVSAPGNAVVRGLTGEALGLGLDAARQGAEHAVAPEGAPAPTMPDFTNPSTYLAGILAVAMGPRGSGSITSSLRDALRGRGFTDGQIDAAAREQAATAQPAGAEASASQPAAAERTALTPEMQQMRTELDDLMAGNEPAAETAPTNAEQGATEAAPEAARQPQEDVGQAPLPRAEHPNAPGNEALRTGPEPEPESFPKRKWARTGRKDSRGREIHEPVLDYGRGDGLLEWMAANGGINFKNLHDMADGDPALLKDPDVMNPLGKIGMPALRRNGGMTVEQAFERMREDGWFPEMSEDTPEAMGANDAADMILDALNGNAVHHPFEGAEDRMMREAADHQRDVDARDAELAADREAMTEAERTDSIQEIRNAGIPPEEGSLPLVQWVQLAMDAGATDEAIGMAINVGTNGEAVRNLTRIIDEAHHGNDSEAARGTGHARNRAQAKGAAGPGAEAQEQGFSLAAPEQRAEQASRVDPQQAAPDAHEQPLPKTVQRYEDANTQDVGGVEKPQGLYTTPGDVESPHADLGGNRTTYTVNTDANVLRVEPRSLVFDPRELPGMRKGAIGEDAGVATLRALVGEDRLREYADLSAGALLDRLNAEHPSVDWERLRAGGADEQDMMSTLGGVLARERGYDAVWASDRDDPRFWEYVALTDNAFRDDSALPSRAVTEAKDAARNGRTGGREDTGDGGLFDGVRPEQTDIGQPRDLRERPSAEVREEDLTPEERKLVAQARASQARAKEKAEADAAERELGEQMRRENVAQGEREADQLGLKRVTDAMFPDERVHYIHDEDGLDPKLKARMRPLKRGHVRKGFYDPTTSRVYILTRNVRTPKEAAWVAAHEIGGHKAFRAWVAHHANVKVGSRSAIEALNKATDMARQNPTVAKLADVIARKRKNTGPRTAAEEALAELQAASLTGDWARISDHYGVDVPEAMKPSLKRSMANYIKRVTRIVNAIFHDATGKHDAFSDEDVRDMLADTLNHLGGDAHAAGRADEAHGLLDSSEEPTSPNGDDMERVGAQWKRKLRMASETGRPDDFTVSVRAPTILRKLGVLRKNLTITRRRLTAIRNDHPELPSSVFENLPALLSDPEVVYTRGAKFGRGHGETNAVIEVKTRAGEPILVGFQDGELKTITPRNDRDGVPGSELLASEIRGSHVLYARDEEALRNAQGFESPQTGTMPSEPRGSRSGLSKSVRFRRDFFNDEPDSGDSILESTTADDIPGRDDGAESAQTPRSKRHHTDGQAEFMRKAGMGNAVDGTHAVRDALENIKNSAKTVRSKANREYAGDWLRQSYVNSYQGLERAVRSIGGLPDEKNPALAAHLMQTASTMEGVLRFGAPEWHQGAIRVARNNVPGLLEGLQPVHGHVPEWLGWMVARRAKLLKEQGRENLFSDADIKHGLSLAKGHEDEFTRAAYNYLRLKNSILDFAEQAGVIDPEMRKAWDHIEYIPFYRDTDEATSGPATKRGLANQSSGIRNLKGGESALKDPLGNIISNFTRLVDASTKNHAALLAVDEINGVFFKKAAHQIKPENIPLDQIKSHLLSEGVEQSTIDVMPPKALRGMARMMAIKPPEGDDVVRVMRGGHAEYYHVEDPLLYRSLTSLNDWQTPTWLKPMIYFRHLLTAGATATPDFWVRNLLRDTGEAWATSGDKFIPVWDTLRGAAQDFAEDQLTQDLVMAGAAFREGYFRTGDIEDVSKSIKRVLREYGKGEDFATKFAKTILNPKRTWSAYRRVAEATEMGSRISLARRHLEGGGNFARAAFEAKDLLNFQRHGDSKFLSFFIRTIPFLNARIQGADRLLRVGSTKGRRGRMASRVAMMAMYSTALYWWNQKNYKDAYDALPDWDRDAYWHIAPGTSAHIRIPKPFELGIIGGTLPERLYGAMQYQLTGHREGDRPAETWDAFMRAITGTMGVGLPQFAEPVAEDIANRDFYFGYDIESRGDKYKRPKNRKSVYTSPTMVEASQGLGHILGPSLNISPKRLEHLWNGYTAGMGRYALAVTDWLTRQATGAPETPAMHMRDFPMVGAIYRGDAPLNSSKYVGEFYDLQEKAQTLKHTIKGNVENGNPGRARNLTNNNRWLLGGQVDSSAKLGFSFTGMRHLNKVRDQMADIRHAKERVYGAADMTGAEKREAIDKLNKRRNALARKTVRMLRERERRIR